MFIKKKTFKLIQYMIIIIKNLIALPENLHVFRYLKVNIFFLIL